MKSLDMLTFVLLVVGGLNWMLDAFGFNLVELLVGSWPVVAKAVYILVGLSAVYQLVTHKWGTSTNQA